MTNYPTLRQANMARQKEWDAGNQIDMSYRGNEMAGEIGEAFENVIQALVMGSAAGRASNVVKKLERERLGINGSRATVEQLGDELADVNVCNDLLAMKAGVDLDAATSRKFNETSEKMGLSTRYVPAAQEVGLARLISNFEGTKPDLVISPDGVTPYMNRWHLIPRNLESNIYLHEFLHNDDDRALHDHPYATCSIILREGYQEVVPADENFYTNKHRNTITLERQPGDVIFRQAKEAHRVMLYENPDGSVKNAWSLFITGPRVRDWGFWCPHGWRHEDQYRTYTGDTSSVGKGCD